MPRAAAAVPFVIWKRDAAMCHMLGAIGSSYTPIRRPYLWMNGVSQPHARVTRSQEGQRDGVLRHAGVPWVGQVRGQVGQRRGVRGVGLADEAQERNHCKKRE